MKLEKQLQLLERITGKKVMLESSQQVFLKRLAAGLQQGGFNADKILMLQDLNEDNIINTLREILEPYFERKGWGFEAQTDFINNCIQDAEKDTGVTVLNEAHECHCGGSCCTDKKSLNESALNEVGNLAVTLNTLIADSQQNWKLRANLIERTVNILEANKELYNWFVDNRKEFLRKLYHHPNDITTYRIANEMTKAMKGMGLSEDMQPIDQIPVVTITEGPGKYLNFIWEALSALELVRQNVNKALEMEPSSSNLGDAARYVDAAYRALKPLEENTKKDSLKENYRTTKENLSLLKKASGSTAAIRKAQSILNKYEKGTWDKEDYESVDQWLDEVTEMWLDTYVSSGRRM